MAELRCEQVHELHSDVFSYGYVWTLVLESVLMTQALSLRKTQPVSGFRFSFLFSAKPSNLCLIVFLHNLLIFNPSGPCADVAGIASVLDCH